MHFFVIWFFSQARMRSALFGILAISPKYNAHPPYKRASNRLLLVHRITAFEIAFGKRFVTGVHWIEHLSIRGSTARIHFPSTFNVPSASSSLPRTPTRVTMYIKSSGCTYFNRDTSMLLASRQKKKKKKKSSVSMAAH
jgi:hypothetical protein